MPKPLTLDDQLCFSLYATSMAITRVYKPVLDRLGLTYPQYLVLQSLWDEDGRTVGAIADRLSLESSTITPLVKRLETAGLVGRERDRGDERRVFVRLTDAGRGLQLECRELAETLLAKAGMSVAEMLDLNSQVRKLQDALTTS